MHGQFVRDMDWIVDRNKLWLWLKTGDLKKGTEALIMAALQQAEPCGTPDATFLKELFQLFIRTHRFQRFKQD